MAEIYCDICDNQLNDCEEYKVVDKLRDKYDDEFIRVCKDCEEEGK